MLLEKKTILIIKFKGNKTNFKMSESKQLNKKNIKSKKITCCKI